MSQPLPGQSSPVDMDAEPDWASLPREQRHSLRLSTSLDDQSHDPGQTNAATLPRFHSQRGGFGRPPKRPSVLDRIASTRSLPIPHLPSSSRPASIDFGAQGPPLIDDQNDDWRATAIGSTPLDRTIDQIGMGRYQWTVLILSGLGWAADNMWIQAVAIILPYVQASFSVTDRLIGIASSSIFVGMFIGSLAWGSISDSYGRRAAFNITLLIAAIFGSLSAFSASFTVLCLLLFCVGTGVGGSMPTDSSNLVENLPVRKHSYVTALSVFFSAGAVIPSVIGLVVLSDQNQSGWRWLLGSLALVTIAFVTGRVVFFRLLESPKYLVHAGRPQEAREILQRIQRFNGGETINIRLGDVRDTEAREAIGSSRDTESARTPRPSSKSRHSATHLQTNHKGYQSVPTDDANEGDDNPEDIYQDEEDLQDRRASQTLAGEQTPQIVRNNHGNERDLPPWLNWIPDFAKAGTTDLVDRYSELFSPDWKRTTILIWIIWAGMSYGFTTFNVFLPKLLQERYGREPSAAAEIMEDKSRKAMIDYLVYSLSSLPGSLISAYMVETRLGRIGTMALSTGLTSLSVLAFATLEWTSSLTLTSIFSSISYAAIYGYTPEVMAPQIRATGCGSASAISRLAGIVAPLTAGWLFAISPALPLYLSVITFAVVATAMAALPIETRGRAEEGAVTGTH